MWLGIFFKVKNTRPHTRDACLTGLSRYEAFSLCTSGALKLKGRLVSVFSFNVIYMSLKSPFRVRHDFWLEKPDNPIKPLVSRVAICFTAYTHTTVNRELSVKILSSLMKNYKIMKTFLIYLISNLFTDILKTFQGNGAKC